ncbi:hypothetical protein ACE38W_01310 [Chitinophaga sp. Hz27]|uniref:hypothetical protein n=1 Tax=Chitinophaga sp. Hz27 TaxID=3347169 RepID=UPI0035D6FB50
MQRSLHRINFITALLISIAFNSFAQADIKKSELEVAKLYGKILEQQDSAYQYADKFGKAFKKLLKDNPATINYNFKRLQDSSHCYINTSTDGNFRIYSWDTWTGGTMHFFNNIYQYKTEGNVFTQTPAHKKSDPGMFCSKIYAVIIKDKTFYLAIFNGIYSTKDVSQSIQAFTLTAGKLDDTVKLFKTRTQMLNRIDVPFDFFSVVDRPERPLELITYNETAQEIYIPLVDKNGQVTHSNLVYHLVDNVFEYIGIRKSK